MTTVFLFFAVVTVSGAVATMILRNLVHCALALVVTFVGLAALYLQLEAQFIGFAQILVYVGAVAILIVFAILLTRGAEFPQQSIFSSSAIVGVLVALGVFGLLAGVIRASHALRASEPAAPVVTVKDIGTQLMTKYVLPLEVVGLLLTAAMIGAVIIALKDKKEI